MYRSLVQRSRPSILVTMLSVAVSLVMSGCGSTDDVNRGSVEGNVTLDGSPLEQGSISFTPTAGTTGPAAYGAITNGKYTIAAGERGPVVGKQQVKIEANRDTGKKDSGGSPILEQYIPAKFNTSSTLVVDMVKGQNTHNFELTSQ